MSEKVAIVTGANKGIGYAITKGLCEKYPGVVYLTARNAELGERAVAKLKALGFNPQFHQLDINDVDSINKFRDYINEKYGGIDILVNNAAIAYKNADPAPFAEQAEVTIDVNYFGLLRVCEALVPLLRPNARLVNLSSLCGHLFQIPGEQLRQKLAASDLTQSQLNDLMNQFVRDAKNGKNLENGWGSSAYVVSKVGVSAYTFILQREFDSKGNGIKANAVHPGYVDTDMTSHKGPLTIEEGAEAPLFLALEADDDVKGKYVWCNKHIIDWFSPLPTNP